MAVESRRSLNLVHYFVDNLGSPFEKKLAEDVEMKKTDSYSRFDIDSSGPEKIEVENK